MKHNISIVQIEEHAKIGFYSIIIDNIINSELEEFLIKIEKHSEKDAAIILYYLDKIAKNGAQERYFRREGKLSDNVVGLPGHYLTEKTDYRLYALRLSESLLIYGNGGMKSTETYQEDARLNKCVTILQKVDDEIKNGIAAGTIEISDKTISGELYFTIYT